MPSRGNLPAGRNHAQPRAQRSVKSRGRDGRRHRSRLGRAQQGPEGGRAESPSQPGQNASKGLEGGNAGKPRAPVCDISPRSRPSDRYEDIVTTT